MQSFNTFAMATGPHWLSNFPHCPFCLNKATVH